MFLINAEIKEALASRDLDKLERTMHGLSDTSLRKDLGAILEDAEEMRSRLRKLKRLKMAVLQMDQKTISELRSYPQPPPAVHGVMVATFLLLGQKEGDIKVFFNLSVLKFYYFSFFVTFSMHLHLIYNRIKHVPL